MTEGLAAVSTLLRPQMCFQQLTRQQPSNSGKGKRWCSCSSRPAALDLFQFFKAFSIPGVPVVT